MRVSAITISLSAATLIASGVAAFAQESSQPSWVGLVNTSPRYEPSQNTLGRFSKTPNGNFNTTTQLEDGDASGMGAGPGGGVPNGN